MTDKAIKLTVGQEKVIRGLKSGGRLTFSSYRSRMVLGATKYVQEATIRALLRANLIVRKEKNPFTEYILTELGKTINID